jgi:hypothetical protein
MTTAMIGLGIGIQMANVATPSSKTTIAGIFDINTSPVAKYDQIDISTYDQGNSFRQFMSGLADPGDFAFMVNFVPNSTTDLFLRGVRGLTQIVTVSLPDGSTWTFTAAILEYGADKLPIDGKMTTSCKCKVSGDVVQAAASAPVNIITPSIAGASLAHGAVFTADVGQWTPSGVSYTYQWKKNGSNIGGATSSTYTTLVGDVGGVITVAVTATNATGSTTATSLGTGAIT